MENTITGTSATDMFIGEQLNENGLSTGEKVALGFGIAGGALVLGFIIYLGVKYIITKKDNEYTATPTEQVNPNMQQLPAQQYAQYIPAPQQQVDQPQPAPAPQPTPQPSITAEQLVPVINQVVQQVNNLSASQQQMVDVMSNMSEAIKNNNSADTMELKNENAALKQQLAAANYERERSDSVANHMMGQYDQLAKQVGAPLSTEYLNNTPKYPNLSTDSIVR